MGSQKALVIIQVFCAFYACCTQGGITFPTENDQTITTEGAVAEIYTAVDSDNSFGGLRPDISKYINASEAGLSEAGQQSDISNYVDVNDGDVSTKPQQSYLDVNTGVSETFVPPAIDSHFSFIPPTNFGPAGQIPSRPPHMHVPAYPSIYTLHDFTSTTMNPTPHSRGDCADGLFARDENSCSDFYRCLPNGGRVKFTCGPFQYFDLSISGCNYKYLVKC